MRVRVSGSCKRKVGPKIRGKWEVQLVGGRLSKLGVGGCPPPKKKVHVWGNSRLPAPGLGLGNFINYPGVVVNNLRLVAKHQGTWLIEAIFSTT